MNQETKSQTIATKVKPSVKTKLEAIAKTNDRKLSYVINSILEESLKKVKK